MRDDLRHCAQIGIRLRERDLRRVAKNSPHKTQGPAKAECGEKSVQRRSSRPKLTIPPSLPTLSSIITSLNSFTRISERGYPHFFMGGSYPLTVLPYLLGCAAHCRTPFLSGHVAPARGTEADRLSAYGRGSEFSTGDVEHLQRQIEQDLRRQPTLSHDASKRRGSPDAETRGQRRRNRGTCLGAFFRC